MTTAAESVRRYIPFFKHRQALNVLDYGTGNMRNALHMAREGFQVIAADLPEQVEKLSGCPALAYVERILATDELEKSCLNVDLVLSTYVFNIIMNLPDRHQYLKTAVANLKQGGYLLMEVRCHKPGADCGSSCEDYFACSDCAKTLTHEELDVLLGQHGLKRISHYYRSHAVAAIYQMQ